MFNGTSPDPEWLTMEHTENALSWNWRKHAHKVTSVSGMGKANFEWTGTEPFSLNPVPLVVFEGPHREPPRSAIYLKPGSLREGVPAAAMSV